MARLPHSADGHPTRYRDARPCAGRFPRRRTRCRAGTRICAPFAARHGPFRTRRQLNPNVQAATGPQIALSVAVSGGPSSPRVFLTLIWRKGNVTSDCIDGMARSGDGQTPRAAGRARRSQPRSRSMDARACSSRHMPRSHGAKHRAPVAPERHPDDYTAGQTAAAHRSRCAAQLAAFSSR